MKKWNKILASILGIYLLMVSFLLIYHVSFHVITKNEKKEWQDDISDVVEDSSCHICNFYLDQELYYEDICVKYLLENRIGRSNSDIESSIQTTVFVQLYLRGPPFS